MLEVGIDQENITVDINPSIYAKATKMPFIHLSEACSSRLGCHLSNPVMSPFVIACCASLMMYEGMVCVQVLKSCDSCPLDVVVVCC